MEKIVGFLFGKQLQCKEVSPAYTYNQVYKICMVWFLLGICNRINNVSLCFGFRTKI